MPDHRSRSIFGGLVALALSLPAAAERSPDPVFRHDAAIGLQIAEQGNRALAQIRSDVRDSLHVRHAAFAADRTDGLEADDVRLAMNRSSAR